MYTPFLNQIKQLSKIKTRFFVPGHKGNREAIPLFGEVLPYDLTEIEGADNLQMPLDTLLQSEKNMSAVYQSGATLYSASGASSCIQAMLSLFCGINSQLIISRNCHVSAVRAMAFLDIQPYWILPKNGEVLPCDIEKMLQKSGAKVVYITSPDYYGKIQNIKQIAEICHKYDAFLLVDNAHGAHLKFIKNSKIECDLHPISLGADACADSAHKTLPCLTPAAMLHIKNKKYREEARQVLNLFTSTSPSYLVLQSLDFTAGLLTKGSINFEDTVHIFQKAIQPAKQFINSSDDPLKVCFVPKLVGLSFTEFESALKKYGILPELSDGENFVLMASPYNTIQDFKILSNALAPFKNLPVISTQYDEQIAYPLPSYRCSIRTAMFSTKKTILVENSVGCVAASLVAPCPPGIPVLIPGEQVQKSQVDQLLNCGILHIDVIK